MARVQKNLPPVDTEVVLPKAVREAAERANELHKKALEIAPPSNDTVKLVQEPEKTLKTVVEDFDPTKPVEVAPPTSENRFSLPGEKAAPPPLPAATPEPTPAPTTEKTRDYERELGAANGRLRQVNSLMTEQNQRIAQLEAMIVQLTQPVTAPEMRAESLITEDERNTYGEDFLNVVGKRVREELGQTVAQLGAEVKNLKGSFSRVAQQQASSQQEQFEEYMDKHVAGWRALNQDPQFIAWLHLPDPASGVIRQQLLANAHQNAQFNRVAWFFNGYNADTAPPSPAPVPTPTLPPGKVPLETLAAPGRAKSAPAPTPPAEEYITQSQINQFYRLVNAGHYKTNPKEKDRLEKLIFNAVSNGRVVNG